MALVLLPHLSALGHGSLSTPLPRNSFAHPLNTTNTSKQAIPNFFSNYYDDGCLVGCDECLHHGANTDCHRDRRSHVSVSSGRQTWFASEIVAAAMGGATALESDAITTPTMVATTATGAPALVCRG